MQVSGNLGEERLHVKLYVVEHTVGCSVKLGEGAGGGAGDQLIKVVVLEGEGELMMNDNELFIKPAAVSINAAFVLESD